MRERDSMDLIVVDVEATGLDPSVHVPLEVAAVNLRTGESLRFVPFLPGEDLANADPKALQVNRYFERGMPGEMLPQGETSARYEQLWDMLSGNRFGGANARFDAEMLRHGYGRARTPRAGGYGSGYRYFPEGEVWHYRLADLGSYACGPLGIDPADVPSLDTVCRRLEVENTDPHSALGDAKAAAQCFRLLKELVHRGEAARTAVGL